MKSRTEGRQFSKREIVEFGDDLDAFSEHLKKIGKPVKRADGRTSYRIGSGWREKAERAREVGAAYLRSKGLPGSSDVWRPKGQNPAPWREGRHEAPMHDERALERRTIDSCIRQMGFERDSREDIAARLVLTATRLEQHLESGETDPAIDQAVMLGELLFLAKVYEIQSATNRRSASKSKRKDWAVDLANELAALGVTFPEAWEVIDEDGIKIYRGQEGDGKEYVYFSGHEEGDDKIERESFRTGYFSPARKALKGSM